MYIGCDKYLLNCKKVMQFAQQFKTVIIHTVEYGALLFYVYTLELRCMHVWRISTKR